MSNTTLFGMLFDEKLNVMRYVMLSFFIALSWNISSQDNLVINPGFEQVPREQKYQNIGLFDLNAPVEMTPTQGITAGYKLANGWYMPTNGTSDYLHGNSATAFGWPIMQARTGTGRGGLILGGKSENRKEYLQAELSQPLKRNRKYCLKFYIAHEKASNYAATEISAYFSNSLISTRSKGVLKIKPHINLTVKKPITHHQGWVEVCGTYVAYGGEKYITIGNFNKNHQSIHIKEIYEDYKQHGSKQGFMHPFKKKAYYYIDDVSLVESKDTSICEQWSSKSSDTTRNWVFLMDASGSMSNENKYWAIKREVQQIAPALPKGSVISLITFKENIALSKKNISSSNTQEIENYFNQITPGGGTGITQGIKMATDIAVEFMDKTDISEIFIFTDGIVPDLRTANSIISNAKEDHPKLRIHTVLFGNSKKGRKNLSEIARTGGGYFYDSAHIYMRKIFHDHIQLKLKKDIDCNSFSECCKPQKLIDEFSINNTTFLLDVSGSMKNKDKLPLLKTTLLNLSDSMRTEDLLSIIQFSATSEIILKKTSYRDKEIIENSIKKLKSKGNTNLEKGIETSVNYAIQNYKANANNTLIIATDGKAEFTRQIKKSIKNARDNNIRVSVLHFSEYEGEKLKKIAEIGNGTYHQIKNNNLWEEFITEIQRKRMGPDFYQYDSTYSAQNKKQMNSYRWSRILYFVGPAIYGAWEAIKPK